MLGHIPLHNISVAAANDRCDNPRDRNLACFEESETFPSIEICRTQEVGILCQMSGGCYISQINAIFKFAQISTKIGENYVLIINKTP